MKLSRRFYLCTNNVDAVGPFTVKELRTEVARQEYAKSTLACVEGTETWARLGDLCPEAFKRGGKKASPKQVALLTYLEHPDAATISAAEASAWLDEALDAPENADKMAAWNEEKLFLFPDLYRDEMEDYMLDYEADALPNPVAPTEVRQPQKQVKSVFGSIFGRKN